MTDPARVTSETAQLATPQNGVPECCCHSPNRKCQHGHPGKHVHHCLPRGLDLGGHCPDDGCPGRCWEHPTPTAPEEGSR